MEGQSQSCTCANGVTGYRTCGRDNEYGACSCDDPSSGGSGGLPIGGSAGNPVSGSGGFSGAGAGGFGGVSGMTGGSAGVTGGSGGLTGGIGGIGGTVGGSSGMTGGIGGVSGGSGGMTGGVGGTTGGSGGMSGTDGGNGGPDHEPLPGEVYGECRDNGECDEGLLCVNDSSNGVAESYCTAPCDALSPMPCPRQHGGGMAVCVLGICVR